MKDVPQTGKTKVFVQTRRTDFEMKLLCTDENKFFYIERMFFTNEMKFFYRQNKGFVYKRNKVFLHTK